MRTFEEFHTFNVDYAKERIIGTRETIFTAIAVNAADDLFYLMLPFSDDRERSIALAIMATIFQAEQCQWYSIISEAWMATQQLNEVYIRPQHNPRRVDCLLITTIGADQQNQISTFEIHRDNEGNAQRLTVHERGDSITPAGGEMTTLLERDVPSNMRRTILKNFHATKITEGNRTIWH